MDAIVIGAGPNGLVAANILVDRGWSVVVLEEQPQPGGAVKTAELTVPGFKHDVFSAFYPLAKASPAMTALELERWGLRWRTAPAALAHASREGVAPMIWCDLTRTVEGLERIAPGDGEAWAGLYEQWTRIGGDVVRSLLAPFPPVAGPLRLAVSLRRDLLRFLRTTLLPVRRLTEEGFPGTLAGLLLAGNALHADLTPEMTLSGFFGYLLCALGQEHGYPVPEGGAGELTHALVRRLESKGGRVECNARVVQIDVQKGRAAGVRTSDGQVHPVRKAVLADVSATALYRDLVASEHLPNRVLEDVARFQFDNGTVKVDWALNRPCPWSVEDIGSAGTIHIADDMNHLTDMSTGLAQGRVPARPCLVVGQMNAADPGRSPEGTTTMWAYAHVPQAITHDESGVISGAWNDREREAFADRMEAEIEGHAPGFRDAIAGRHVMAPPDLERANRNLVGGAVNGGTSQLHQQLVFRPIPGLGRAETPVRGLYLASASAHPGGGVHGACGANAARAALIAGRSRKVVAATSAVAAARAIKKRS
ncbi:MAG TPA: NAD(P)/FAD-dependent oxidoreductase [Actinomycetota bacterium]|nr:NAD(P)/FAD-dependent oxidoreductase [Actinomycetota bacterium]